jgi:hypothetical protein
VSVLWHGVIQRPRSMPSLPRNASGNPQTAGHSGPRAWPNPPRIALHAPGGSDSLFCGRYSALDLPYRLGSMVTVYLTPLLFLSGLALTLYELYLRNGV